MLKEFRLGIDLSVKACGFVLIRKTSKSVKEPDGNWVNVGKGTASGSQTLDLSRNTRAQLNETVKKVEILSEGERLAVYIEINNFINPKLTNQGFRLLGMIEGLSNPETWIIKYFNANEGHKLIGIKSGTLRETCKKLSIKHAASLGFNTNDDNLADAFNVAMYGDRCQSMDERHETIKKERKNQCSVLKERLRQLKKRETVQTHLLKRYEKKLSTASKRINQYKNKQKG